jgi:hypothetical protein
MKSDNIIGLTAWGSAALLLSVPFIGMVVGIAFGQLSGDQLPLRHGLVGGCVGLATAVITVGGLGRCPECGAVANE